MAETTESAAPAAAPPPPPAPEADPSDTMFQALDAPADEPTSAPSAAEPQPAPPSTPSAAPAPAAAAEPAAAPPDRQVPLAVLLEERRKSEEREARLTARLEALEKGQKPAEAAPPAEPETPVPDFLEDPKGYVDAQLARATKALEKLEKGGAVDPRIQAIEARQAETELSTALVADHERFTAKTPDFPEALNYARVARAKQLEVLNPGVDPKQIIQWVHQEERGLAAHLVRNGINPSERVYELAKSMGYTPKQAAALAAASPPANGMAASVVDPGLTLNSTPGTTHSEVDDSEPDILAQAQAERFVRARRN